MGVMTDAGRAAMAKSVKEQPIFLALGLGNAEWGENPPPEDISSTALLEEIGRKALSRSLYVLPDTEGTIEVPISIVTDEDGAQHVETERYAVSETPTRHLYVEFNLDYADALGCTLRELGLFVGSVLKPGLSSGKTYFSADDFDDPGLLFQLEYREPMVRRAESRMSFAWVLSI
ncbi:hypothetical protein FACS1894216_02710 [Synergistales bacterium]|nr:hypothetical protein FACS1894216_02710 [Synergistales bacterium]